MEAKLTGLLRVRPHQHPYTAQTVVEFALVSLVLFALIFGIIDFGRAVMTRSMLTNAVREIVRTGEVAPNGTTESFVNVANSRSPGLNLVTGNVTVKCTTWLNTTASATCDPMNRFEVCITYNFTLIVTHIVGLNSGLIVMSECGHGLIQ